VPEECTRRTTTPPDKTSAGLALKSREEEGTNMHTAIKKEQIMHIASRDLCGDAYRQGTMSLPLPLPFWENQNRVFTLRDSVVAGQREPRRTTPPRR